MMKAWHALCFAIDRTGASNLASNRGLGTSQAILEVAIKPVIHHFHSNPPHHGMRYYLAIAVWLLVPALAYLVWGVISASL